MFIGIARFELFIPAARSLKDKRQVIRSVMASAQKRLHVAVAEVDHQDLWQRAAIGVSCVGESERQCRDLLAEAEKAVSRASLDGAEVVGREFRIVALEDL